MLESKVDEMIARADQLRDPNAESCLPLIRLKVRVSLVVSVETSLLHPSLSPPGPPWCCGHPTCGTQGLLHHQLAIPIPQPELTPPVATQQVDYTGFSTINSQRFGHRLVDRVANPPDVLAWQKQPQRRAKPDAAGNATDEMDNLDLRMMPEALDQVGPAPSPRTHSPLSPSSMVGS